MSNSPNAIPEAIAQSRPEEEELIQSREPVDEPVQTRGNAFWKGNERFLIKGIHYVRQRPAEGASPSPRDPTIDVLSDQHLDLLNEDIKFLSELGLNTVLVRDLDPGKNHSVALKLLAHAGFYVLVTLQMHEPYTDETFVPGQRRAVDLEADLQPYYPAERVTNVLRLVDELAEYPNILGFTVRGDALNMPKQTRTAELMRASVRDIKTFLCRRGGRRVPVGVSQPDSPMFREPAVQYFTAGEKSSRIDFWALQCFSWAYQSSFQISGWKNLVERIGKFPVPMFLSAYGAKIQKPRIWEEVGCLYSPDMTGVFNGGCAYAYFENGGGYGLVEMGEDGMLRKKPEAEFEMLKQKLREVSKQTAEKTFGVHPTGREREYETWVGEYPKQLENRWYTRSDTLPIFPLDWEKFMEELQEEHEWELVGNTSDSGSLADAVDGLKIDD